MGRSWQEGQEEGVGTCDMKRAELEEEGNQQEDGMREEERSGDG